MKHVVHSVLAFACACGLAIPLSVYAQDTAPSGDVVSPPPPPVTGDQGPGSPGTLPPPSPAPDQGTPVPLPPPGDQDPGTPPPNIPPGPPQDGPNMPPPQQPREGEHPMPSNGSPSDPRMNQGSDVRGPNDRQGGSMGPDIKQIQGEMRRFSSVLKSIQKRIASLEKQKITVPEEIKSNVKEAQTAVDDIMKAEKSEDVMDQMQTVQTVGGSLQSYMPQLEMLARLPSMLKQANREIARLEKAYGSAVTKTARAKLDASAYLKEWRDVLDEMKASLAEVSKGTFEEGDDPQQIIGEEIFNRIEEASRYQQTISMLLDAKRNVKQMTTALKKYEKTIAKLEKKKEDMTRAKELLAEMQEKYDEVGKVLAGGMDPEEVESVLGDLDGYVELRDEIEDLLHLSTPSLFEKQMQAPVPGGSIDAKGLDLSSSLPPSKSLVQSGFDLLKTIVTLAGGGRPIQAVAGLRIP